MDSLLFYECAVMCLINLLFNIYFRAGHFDFNYAQCQTMY